MSHVLSQDGVRIAVDLGAVSNRIFDDRRRPAVFAVPAEMSGLAPKEKRLFNGLLAKGGSHIRMKCVLVVGVVRLVRVQCGARAT